MIDCAAEIVGQVITFDSDVYNILLYYNAKFYQIFCVLLKLELDYSSMVQYKMCSRSLPSEQDQDSVLL